MFSWYDVITCKSKQIIGCALSDVFIKFSYFLIFLKFQIDLITLDTDVEQFTLTTKISSHIIFKSIRNFECRTADMRKELKYKSSTGKLYDILSTSNSCYCMSMTLKFCYQHIPKLPQSYIPNYTNYLTFPLLYAFFRTCTEFSDISRFPEIPEKW